MSLIGQAFSGLRLRLLFLVVLTCAPLAALTLHTAWDERRRQEASLQQRARRLMQVSSRQERELVGATSQLLLAIAESAPVRSGSARGSRRFLQDILASYPRYANLGVLSTNGEILATAGPFSAAIEQSQRAFFDRALRGTGLTLGTLSQPEAGATPLLSFGYPVITPQGKIQGAVFALLTPPWFGRDNSEITSQLSQGYTWTEIDPGGVILARFPGPESWVGHALPNPDLLAAVTNRLNGTTKGRNPEGTAFFYAFTSRPSQLLPGNTIGILGVPKDALFAAADRALVRNLAWLGGAVLLALVLGWVGSSLLIVRPVNSLVRSSTQLASGELATRSGLRHGTDELGQLSQAFDRMAQAMEQRERDRERASHKLQALSQRLVEVQESERRHIARELHDEIGQALTAAEMNLQAALRAPATASVQRRLQAGIEAVEQVLEQVHDLSLNLRPSMLDDLGLEPALRWYTRRQSELAGFQAEFRSDTFQERFDPLVETECFRVAQEALTNVVRHAQARSVSVDLSKKDRMLHLSIRDDGVGFDVSGQRDHAVHGASLGLLSMEERATLAGGGLEINSAPGAGTVVRAWFPVHSPNSDWNQ